MRYVVLVAAAVLVGVGLWAALTRKHDLAGILFFAALLVLAVRDFAKG
jgi:hypothetical protein